MLGSRGEPRRVVCVISLLFLGPFLNFIAVNSRFCAWLGGINLGLYYH